MVDQGNNVFYWLGGGGAALIAMAVWIRKLLRQDQMESMQIEYAKADQMVVKNLVDEVSRLSAQNKKLATIVNELQLQVANLNAEVYRLRAENNEYQKLIDSLRN